MSDQLRILDALEAEFARATEADERAHATRRRRSWRPHGLSLALLVGGLSAATVAAAAATNLFGLADPVPAPRPGDAPVEARPLAATAALAGLRSGDPDGLPAWDVRVSRSKTGEVCTAVGQVQNGSFGIVGLDRKFRVLPLGAADACGRPPVGAAVQVGARAAVGRGSMTPRTLVVGIAGPEVRAVALRRGHRETPLALGRNGAFLAVLRGLPEVTRPHLRVTDRAGTTRAVKLADSGDVETPDPDRKAMPWAIQSGPASDLVHPLARGASRIETEAPDAEFVAGLTCVRARQQPSAANFAYDGYRLAEPFTPTACRRVSDRQPLVAALRRLAPSDDGSGRGFFYPVAPARTIAIGVASPDVVRLELRTPAGARTVPIDSKTRAFAAILDGRTDPAALELRARLRNGSIAALRRENATFIGDNGRAYDPGPSRPAWRDVREVQRAFAERFTRERTPGSTQVGPAAKDPAGGPPWAARTWTAVADRPTGNGAPLQCAAFGPLVDGVVRQPRGAAARPDEASGGSLLAVSSGCALSVLARRIDPTDGSPLFLGAAPTVYVDDPASATPKIVRVTLSGVYPGVVAAEALGLPKGKQVKATVGPRGAVLAMLGPEAARPFSNLRFRLHYQDGTTVHTDYTDFSPSRRGIEARAVDPKGGPPWGVQAAAAREPRIPSFPGQIIDGRPAMLNDRTGEVSWANARSSSGNAALVPDAQHPVWFEQAGHPDGGSHDDPSPADTARRTLPGRTVIYGAAAPGVTRVTIQTPRDVRTVRPAGKGRFFLVVYDGRFTQGRIRVIADGPGIHAVEQQRADGRPDGPPPTSHGRRR